jgi:hypothetical protein
VIRGIRTGLHVDDPAPDADRIFMDQRALRFRRAAAGEGEKSEDHDAALCVHRKRID